MGMVHLNEKWGNPSVLPGIGSHMDFSTLVCRQTKPLKGKSSSKEFGKHDVLLRVTLL